MTRYWKYQLTGWLGYSAIGMTINLLDGRALGPLLAGHAVMMAAGIGMTHGLRREIHRRRTPGQPVSRLWPLLAASSLVISAILAALVIGMNVMLSEGHWDLVATAALWWGMWLAVGVWTVLYVRFSDQRGHEAREGQLQLALTEAQLRALEAQINPHFLFNSLNSIRALVEIDPGRAQEMLTRLSNVLRKSLRPDAEHTVALESELPSVCDYLALETVRFGDRLRTAVKVDPAAARCRIPPMVLQTLVENAIKHGIGQEKGRGEVRIEASIEDEVLRLVVENTGRLRARQVRESPGDAVPLGLKNIRERLKLLYGDRASLRIEGEGDRVKATVAIPVGE